ncbi:14970_t:CDS:2, partial [Cetraspora pellucida]
YRDITNCLIRYYDSWDALGDQCDYCGQLLNSVELINPQCKTDNSTPITRKSNHMFLDLSKLQPKVENWIEKTSIEENVPFHTIMFPCSLLGIDEEWTLLHHIRTAEYLNYENTKFSKSRNVGVFGDDAKDIGIPSTYASVTESIVRQLNAPLRNIPDSFTMDIEADHQIGKAEYLFKRIDEKMAEGFSKKFAGESRDDKKTTKSV